jgi:Carbohydrate/starch-binding module (family 21)
MNFFVPHSTPVTGKNSSFTRHSNSAGTPLPYIPRRGSHRSVNSAQSLFPSREESMSTSPPITTDPPFAKANLDGGMEGPSSDSPLQFDPGKEKPSPYHRPPRSRPPEPLTPVSAVQKPPVTALQFARSPCMASEAVNNSDNQTPPSSPTRNPQRDSGKKCNLSIDLASFDSPNWSPSTFSDLDVSASADAHLSRRKSGEPLKSSLKCKLPVARGDLSVITDGGFVPSRSEPGTPSHSRSKSVQFAAQLEKVKLFLAEQKPLAVSRDGSPTDDTSGTESDFPLFIYGKSDENRKKKSLVMEVVNMPQRGSSLADVTLEDVSLSQDATIHGHVKVRNLAFQKSVAVRFTFDDWHTISEVTAKHEQSLNAGNFDRFSFLIRIHNILSMIENKSLLLAVRYSVNGLELWDNNGGQNYQFKFSDPKSKKQPGLQAGSETQHSVGIADLKDKLDEVIDEEKISPGNFITSRRKQSKSGAPAKVSDADAFTFDSHIPLSSRYDFSASLKKPWKPTEFPLSQLPTSHMRMSTYPTSNPRDALWYQKRAYSNPPSRRGKPHSPQLTRGSPRIDNDEHMLSVPIIQDEDVDVVEEDQISVKSFRESRNRSHKGGYLDDFSPRRGKVDSPQSAVGELSNLRTIPIYCSFSPTIGVKDQITLDSSARDSSDDPTPPATSTSSDSQSPLQPPSPLPDESVASDFSQNSLDIDPEADMSLFLDRFVSSSITVSFILISLVGFVFTPGQGRLWTYLTTICNGHILRQTLSSSCTLPHHNFFRRPANTVHLYTTIGLHP